MLKIVCLVSFCAVTFLCSAESLDVPFSPTPWLKTRVQLYGLMPKNAVVAEIGAAGGWNARDILSQANPKMLFLVDNDPNAYNTLKERFGADTNVTIFFGNSVDLARKVRDGFFDWIYIDADHAYKSVRDDLHAWYPKVKNGGFICGHDYFKYHSFGVVRAVNEFCALNGLEIRYVTHQCPSSGPLYVNGARVYAESFAIKKESKKRENKTSV